MADETKPFAWAVFEEDGSLFNIYVEEKTAKNVCSVWDVVPLYSHPSPSLTDAEREAIEWAIHRFRDWVNDFQDIDRSDALRKLLERLT